MVRNISLHRWITAVFVLVAFAVSGCHREVAIPPLTIRNIRPTDKFFDVWPTSPTRAYIVGDRGKVLLTEDSGKTFKRLKTGVDLGIFAIQMTGDKNGYLAGQDGLVMRTQDGGETWQRINSRTNQFLFSLSFTDRLNGFIVGDRSVVLSTNNGGETFFKRQLQRVFPPELQDFAMPYEEPKLYGVKAVDLQHAWIVGELGRIWATSNGGKSWQEQQMSLVDQWKRALGPNEDQRFKDFILPTFFSVSFRDDKHGAACGLEGWVIQTDDGGQTWRFAPQADKPGGPDNGLVPGAPQIPAHDPLFAVDLFGSDQGMATGLTGTAVRLQPNGAWAHDTAFPNIPVTLSQVRFFDAMHGWVVGYGVILHTDDGGKTWRFCQG
jgi:photosystem II stability/assembly factor-like uncharacterized protein